MQATVETAYQNILVEIDGAAAIVTINRESKLNALNSGTLDELRRAFDELEMHPDVRGIILTGAGTKAFVAGADIHELKPLQSLGGVSKCHVGQGLLRHMEMLSKPIIAAINGFALGGGCELALACDFRIASDNAKIGLPEVSLGIIPGYGGTQRLPRLVGKGRALELIMTGVPVAADEAARIGLVNRVVPQAELIPAARALVAQIAKNGPLAVAAAKRAVHQGMEVDLDRGLQIEALGFGVLCGTRDKEEGLTAFIEKRKAAFEGC